MPNKLVRLAVLGSDGVGKTTFCEQNLRHSDQSADYSSEADIYSIQLELEDGMIDVELLDTEVSEKFSVMRKLCLQECDGFILMFSLDSEVSLLNLWPIVKQIYVAKQSRNVPIVIVGNKCDLGDTKLIVSRNLADQAEHKLKGTYFECSARYNLNVDRAIRYLVTRTAKRKQTEHNKCHIQ